MLDEFYRIALPQKALCGDRRNCRPTSINGFEFQPVNGSYQGQSCLGRFRSCTSPAPAPVPTQSGSLFPRNGPLQPLFPRPRPRNEPAATGASGNSIRISAGRSILLLGSDCGLGQPVLAHLIASPDQDAQFLSKNNCESLGNSRVKCDIQLMAEPPSEISGDHVRLEKPGKLPSVRNECRYRQKNHPQPNCLPMLLASSDDRSLSSLFLRFLVRLSAGFSSCKPRKNLQPRRHC